MVQEFHVLRCFSCQSFQVQQVKKVNRWSCKLCGEKQSLLKEFGRGSGADCRRHVQKLNAMRGAMMEEQERNTWLLWKQVEADREDEAEEQRDDQVTQTQVSCWNKYLDIPEKGEPEEKDEDDGLMDRQQFQDNGMIDSCDFALACQSAAGLINTPGGMNRKRKRREGRPDSRGEDRWTPEQSLCSSLMKKPAGLAAAATSLNHTSAPSLNHTSAPSLRNTSAPSLNHTSAPSLRNTSAPSLNHTSAPSLNHTSAPSLNHTSAPSLNHTSAPSESTAPMSRWVCSLSSDCHVIGCSQEVGGAVPLSCHDVISQTPSLSRPHPLLPVSSMFQSGDELSLDDEYDS